MKKLKTILASVYIVLILLLLLFMLRKCHRTEPEPTVRVDTVIVERPIHDTVIVTPPIDTTAVDTSAVREAEQTGQSGNLKVTLLWDFAADIDLHVVQPNRKEIFFCIPKTPQQEDALMWTTEKAVPEQPRTFIGPNLPKANTKCPSSFTGRTFPSPCPLLALAPSSYSRRARNPRLTRWK